MTVFAIAALHCLFPIIGALLGKSRGLVIGTVIGVIAAPILGALAFTIPDLIGVGIGYLIGTGLIGDDADQTDFSEIWKKFCESVASVLNFLKKLLSSAFSQSAFTTLSVLTPKFLTKNK